MCGIISACFTDCNVAVYDSDVGTVNISIVLLLIPRNVNCYTQYTSQCFVGIQIFCKVLQPLT